MPFRILSVCTGNICRSPQAELLLRAGFEAAHTADASWQLPEIASAGTRALVGERMPQPAADLLREVGVDPDAHRGRQLTRELVEESDLILTMAREHRSAVAKLLPRASRYTFTLREFARTLAEPIDGPPANGDFSAWLALAASRRGFSAATPEDDDIVDPYRRSEATYRASFGQVMPCVNRAVSSVTRTGGKQFSDP
jgi:protein-tyrosine phosphatase